MSLRDKALRHLMPLGGYATDEKGKIIVGEDGKKHGYKVPTKKQLTDAEAAVKAAFKTEEYKEKRIAEYPDVGDQLDAIWKEINRQRLSGVNIVSDADSVLGKILAVKKKYPKPV